MREKHVIRKCIWKMRRTLKKLGCKVKVAYQLGENGRIENVNIQIVHDSETATDDRSA